MASEVGVLDVPPEQIVLQKGRLQPGRMFLVDTEQGRIIADEEIKRAVARAAALPPVAATRTCVAPGRSAAGARTLHAARSTRRCCSGSSPSATPSRTCGCCSRRWPTNGVEAVGSMGNDTPLAVLSDRPQLLLQLLQAAVRAGDQPADRLPSARS